MEAVDRPLFCCHIFASGPQVNYSTVNNLSGQVHPYFTNRPLFQSFIDRIISKLLQWKHYENLPDQLLPKKDRAIFLESQFRQVQEQSPNEKCLPPFLPLRLLSKTSAEMSQLIESECLKPVDSSKIMHPASTEYTFEESRRLLNAIATTQLTALSTGSRNSRNTITFLVNEALSLFGCEYGFVGTLEFDSGTAPEAPYLCCISMAASPTA